MEGGLLMNLLSPAEVVDSYAETGKKKAEMPVFRLLLLGILAGALIALGSAVSNTAVHSIANMSLAKLISGLVFPFGLAMIVVLGAELFTGNSLIVISVCEKKIIMQQMLRNWLVVYLANLLGALLVAAGCAFFGQLSLSEGQLAVYTVKVAAAKTSIPFSNGVVLGFFCNCLVVIGVLMSVSAKDTAGKIMGAYLPVAYFVICGFEHCVANMYYIPAGIFAARIPQYAQVITEAGIDTASLTWGNFFMTNLLPVTIGNILGGVAVGVLFWAGQKKRG